MYAYRVNPSSSTKHKKFRRYSHFSDVIMSAVATQITGVSVVCSTVFFRRRSKKTSKPRVTGLCLGYPPLADGFPSHRACSAENISIWWLHHGYMGVAHICNNEIGSPLVLKMASHDNPKPLPDKILPGLILGLLPAYERRRYFVTTSLTGWVEA